MRSVPKSFISQSSFWLAAITVGIISVLYAELVGLAQNIHHDLFLKHPYLITLAIPPLFVLSTFLVRYFAPEARGSGIPQVLRAIHLSESPDQNAQSAIAPLVAIKTAVIKVLSSVLGIFSGASIGREGPTVQIAASTFAWVGNRAKKLATQADIQSYLVAGGAAGVAAAFNTPLAGIAFAIEEIGETKFPKFKENVMLSVVIAGIAAQAFAGDYLYFGRPTLESPPVRIILHSILIGAIGGACGCGFAWALSRMAPRIFAKNLNWIKKALICGVICAAINFATQDDSSGSGYEVIRRLMDTPDGNMSLLFGAQKFVTSTFSYLSGMAGGIFSPSLSIGAGIGVMVSQLLHLGGIKICALIGMVAFFSGVVQAPLTAVIIVVEMTDKHALIIPLMVSAYVSQAIAKKLMPVSLYRHLAGLD